MSNCFDFGSHLKRGASASFRSVAQQDVPKSSSSLFRGTLKPLGLLAAPLPWPLRCAHWLAIM